MIWSVLNVSSIFSVGLSTIYKSLPWAVLSPTLIHSFITIDKTESNLTEHVDKLMSLKAKKSDRNLAITIWFSKERQARFELVTLSLGSWCSTNWAIAAGSVSFVLKTSAKVMKSFKKEKMKPLKNVLFLPLP